MRSTIYAVFGLLALVCSQCTQADQWVPDAKWSKQYPVPADAKCDAAEVDRSANGRESYHLCEVKPGFKVPVNAKLIASAPTPPAPAPSPAPAPQPAPPPASRSIGAQYTDIVTGPSSGGENGNGAFLRIFGSGFGTSGTVTIGGGQAVVKRWTDTQIVVQPGAAARSPAFDKDGNAIPNIAINGKMTALTFTVVPGRITIVPPGVDHIPAVEAAAAGDHVYIKGGPRSQVFGQYGSFFSIHHKGGTAAAPIVISGYPGDEPLFVATSHQKGFHFYQSPGHVVLANMRINANGKGVGIGNSGEDCPTDFRYVNNEVFGFFANGGGDAAISGSGTNYKWFGNHVHDNSGNKLYHGLYFDARCANAGSSELAYNHIHHQGGGRGIQIFGDASRPRITNMSVHHNTIHDVALNCILFGDRTGEGMQAYNNVVYRCADTSLRGKVGEQGNAGSCIRFNDPAVEADVYSNTFVDCDLDKGPDSAAITFERQKSVTLKNNIVVSAKCLAETPPSTRTVSGNDWMCAGLPAGFDSTGISVDPQFVDKPLYDLRLRAGSPAAGKGAL